MALAATAHPAAIVSSTGVELPVAPRRAAAASGAVALATVIGTVRSPEMVA